jgi:hypothetical protein
MPLRYLLDEDLRGGGLWQAIQQHNTSSPHPLDAVRVGDPPDLPLGTFDPDILIWAEREVRVLVSRDQRSLPQHLAAHLRGGRHLPGIFIILKGATVPAILDFLVLAAYAGDPLVYQDRMEHIP